MRFPKVKRLFWVGLKRLHESTFKGIMYLPLVLRFDEGFLRSLLKTLLGRLGGGRTDSCI